jgi:hypothetical protein
MKVWIACVLMVASFVAAIILLGQCSDQRASTDKASGMLEQCQRDFDVLLNKCYGGVHGSD